MTDAEAITLISERAEEMINNNYVQWAMLNIAHKKGKEKAEQWLISAAIASLCISDEGGECIDQSTGKTQNAPKG